MKIPQLLLLAALAGCHAGSDPAARAEARLRHEVETAGGFRQVRAAEALGPFAEFPADSESPQVRIGQYRVRIAAGRREYEEVLRRRALDGSAPEQCHALESAAKLAIRFSPEERRQLWDIVNGPDSPAAGYALWLLAANGDAGAARRVTAGLENGGPPALTCAYASGFLPELPEARETALRRLLEREPADSLLAAFTLWALACHGKAGTDVVRRRLRALPGGTVEKVLRFHLAALGEAGTAEDLAELAGYLDSPEPEIANAAAGAILRITGRAGR
ncbi:MAG: hypothetical protein ACI406_01830 [Victivallis vadensis]